jgi:hypothetical protein
MQQIYSLGTALIDEHEAATRLGLSVKTLRRWRWLRRGPPWVKIGAAVRYAPVDLVTFIDANRQIIAADNGKAA